MKEKNTNKQKHKQNDVVDPELQLAKLTSLDYDMFTNADYGLLNSSNKENDTIIRGTKFIYQKMKLSKNK